MPRAAQTFPAGSASAWRLARALLHDSPVYIFDEATSNIDVESENDIMALAHELAKEKTVILISHRLANVVPSARIYVMEHGAVVQAGTHSSTAGAGRAVRHAVGGPAGAGAGWKGGRGMKKTRGNFAVMARLVGLVRPLLGVMAGAVAMGVAGFLCAIFIPVLGGWALLDILGLGAPLALGTIFACVLVFALARGVLHYAEQACNHFIAFKLLALIRDKVFTALRRLAPARLEGRDKGELISILTADIELLEVFYAHTISPVCIAALVSAAMALFIRRVSPGAGRAGAGRLPCGGRDGAPCRSPARPGRGRGLPRALRRPERVCARFPARPAREHPVRRRHAAACRDGRADGRPVSGGGKNEGGCRGERRCHGHRYSLPSLRPCCSARPGCTCAAPWDLTGY